MSNDQAIPFNKPSVVGSELDYIRMAVESGHISANGSFSDRCRAYFRTHFGVQHSLITPSCTDALEMAALLLNITPGDEVILPSYSYVSTANPFALRGANIIFADSCADHPNMDVSQVQALISSRTRAVVCVHYAGMACDMDALKGISSEFGIPLIEDAAHAIGSRWKAAQHLGTIGDLGVLSFHETKNVTSGEGGALFVNSPALAARADVIAQKGTNRTAFREGRTPCYEWVDLGSSFMASEITTAYLYAQLEKAETITAKRLSDWNYYHKAFAGLGAKGFVQLPVIPEGAENNGHIYYLTCRSGQDRDALIAFLASRGINAVFHYQALHRSAFHLQHHPKIHLPNAEKFSDRLVRLPMFFSLTRAQQDRVVDAVTDFYKG